MTRDLRKIARKYPGKTGLSSIGRTYDNREIWCLRVGNPSAAKKLVIDAAIHAREWKNTQVIMRQTEEILREYGEHRARFRSTCLYILPMDNPDGVTISAVWGKWNPAMQTSQENTKDRAFQYVEK